MKSPFKFLDSYTKDDRAIFFGRDREIEELYHRVFESRIMLVYGVSGTGKSSLIHCGLANKFQDTDWLPIVIRRGGNIIESMSAGIRSASLTKQQNKFSTPADFKKGVRSLYLDHYKPVFFIFDQFEELFIFGDKEERRTFIHIVKLLTESELQCRMIFVMREEYMAGVTEFERIIPTFFCNRVRIERMSHLNALDAIIQPCKVFNICLEESFAESLLEKLSPGETDVELTYLQVFLDKIYRLAVGSVPPPGGESKGGSSSSFTLSLLSRTGNVSDLLGDFLEEQISQLANPDEGLAVLKSFVSVKGSRRQMNEEEVSEYARTLGQPLKENDLRALLHSFVNLRILCDKDQKGKYELRHDALANKIYEKISLVEKEIMEIRQFVENAWNSHQKRGVLISAADLDYIAPYESRLFLPDELEELIRKSKNELVRAKKRRRNIFTTAGLLLIILLSVLTSWAIRERNNALKREIQVKTTSYKFTAQGLVNEDPTVAIRLMEYAFKLDSADEDIKNNYERIYYSNNFYKKVELFALKNVKTRSFLPDGKYMITALVDGTVEISDWSGEVIITFKRNAGSVDLFRFSPDAKHIVTVSWDGVSKLWDGDGNFIRDLDWEGSDEIIGISPDGTTVLENGSDGQILLRDLNGKVLKSFKIHQDNIFIGVYSKDGKYIVTGSDDKTAKLWDLHGRIIQTFNGHQECVNCIDFSDDGQFILTGSDDNTARIWNMNGDVLSVLRSGEEIYSAVFFPDNNSVWTISSFLTICKWNIILNPRTDFRDQTRINSIEFSPDGRLILAGCAGNQARLYDLNGNLIRTFNTGTMNFTRAAFSPDGNAVLTNYRSDSTGDVAVIWDLSGNKVQGLKTEISGTEAYYVDFSNDGKSILLGFTKPVVSIFNMQGILTNSIKNIGGFIYSVTFSPDNKLILTGSFDKTAKLWNLDGSLIRIFNHDDFVLSVAFSPDSKYILTGSIDKTAKLWTPSGELIRVFSYNSSDDVYSVAFSPDSKKVVTGHGSGLVKIWNLNGSLLQTIDTKSVQIWALAFSPDGRYLVTGSQTGIKLFEIKAPMEEFLKNDSIENLSVEQQLRYNLTTFEDILNSKQIETILEGADYFLGAARLEWEPEQKNKALKSSGILFEKALSIKETNEILLGLYNVYSYGIAQHAKNVNDSSKLSYLFNRLLSTNTAIDLIKTGDFFSRSVSIFDNDTAQIQSYTKAVIFYKKAFENTKDEDLKMELVKCYDHLSQAHLNTGEYNKAINSAKRGIELSDDVNLYRTLVLSYVLNDQFSEAESIVKEFRADEGRFISLRSAILRKADDIEESGVTHPDLEKLREVLKK